MLRTLLSAASWLHGWPNAAKWARRKRRRKRRRRGNRRRRKRVRVRRRKRRRRKRGTRRRGGGVGGGGRRRRIRRGVMRRIKHSRQNANAAAQQDAATALPTHLLLHCLLPRLLLLFCFTLGPRNTKVYNFGHRCCVGQRSATVRVKLLSFCHHWHTLRAVSRAQAQQDVRDAVRANGWGVKCTFLPMRMRGAAGCSRRRLG